MLAYCGLQCDTCPIFLATLEQDESKKLAIRVSIAEQLTTIYGMKSSPESIADCDGCRAETGRIFSGCAKCPVRECAMQKNLENCAYCSDYACNELLSHYAFDPDSRKRLEEIRKSFIN